MQTYTPIEVIVVEDGECSAKELIKTKFAKENITYHSTGKHVGRTVAGNIGLSLASGKYLNFLDDDDLLYPTHIAQLVTVLETSNQLAAYSIARECVVKKNEKKPYYRTFIKFTRFKQPYNRLLLMQRNFFPIQSVLFCKKLYDLYGGFDEELEQLEDWDLWVRYSSHTDYVFLNQITSEYKVPIWSRERAQRNKLLSLARQQIYKKFATYPFLSTAYSVGLDTEYLISKYQISLLKRVKKLLKRLFNISTWI